MHSVITKPLTFVADAALPAAAEATPVSNCCCTFLSCAAAARPCAASTAGVAKTRAHSIPFLSDAGAQLLLAHEVRLVDEQHVLSRVIFP